MADPLPTPAPGGTPPVAASVSSPPAVDAPTGPVVVKSDQPIDDRRRALLKAYHEGKGASDVQFVAPAGNPAPTPPAPGNGKPTGDVAGTATPASPADQAERLAKAKAALKRWQWPDDMIDKLPTEDLLSRGARAAESQSEFDRVASERAKLRDEVKQLVREETAKTRPTEDGDEPPEPDPTDVDAILARIGEDKVYGELAGPLSQVIKGLQAKHEQQLTDLSERHKRLTERTDSVLLQHARAELRPEFPGLNDSATFDRVVKRVYQLAALPGYVEGPVDVAKLMRDAARMEGVAVNGTKSLADIKRALLSSQPDGDGLPARVSALPPQDRKKMAYTLLASGKSLAEVQQLMAT